MAHGDEEKYWYNLETGAVERGFVSPATDRVGPFDTPDEAERALEVLRENSRRWDEDEAEDDR